MAFPSYWGAGLLRKWPLWGLGTLCEPSSLQLSSLPAFYLLFSLPGRGSWQASGMAERPDQKESRDEVQQASWVDKLSHTPATLELRVDLPSLSERALSLQTLSQVNLFALKLLLFSIWSQQ